MSSLIVMRGSDRLGPFQTEELAELIEEGVLLPEDACAPQDQPSQVRPISWWLATYRQQGDPGTPQQAAVEADTTSCSGIVEQDQGDNWRDDPLFAGRMALGGDTPVTRNDPPADRARPRHREQQYYRGRPAILAQWKSLSLVTMLAAIIVYLHLSQRLDDAPTAIAMTVLALVLSSLAVCRYASLYLVTDRRVELVEGLLAKSSREVRIADIRAINVSRKGLLGVLGIGTVEFASAGGDDIEVAFRDIWNAAGVKRLVRDLQDQESTA